MKLITAVAAATTTLVVGGGLYAASASASPSVPVPAATPTAGSSAGPVAGVRVAWFYGALTSEQRTCLADAKLQRPQGRLTDEQRKVLAAQVKDALSHCGVTLPARLADRQRLGFGWAALTPEQQKCLADVRLTRPIGRLTDAERAAVRQSVADAVRACGVAR